MSERRRQVNPTVKSYHVLTRLAKLFLFIVDGGNYRRQRLVPRSSSLDLVSIPCMLLAATIRATASDKQWGQVGERRPVCKRESGASEAVGVNRQGEECPAGDFTSSSPKLLLAGSRSSECDTPRLYFCLRSTNMLQEDIVHRSSHDVFVRYVAHSLWGWMAWLARCLTQSYEVSRYVVEESTRTTWSFFSALCFPTLFVCFFTFEIQPVCVEEYAMTFQLAK